MGYFAASYFAPTYFAPLYFSDPTALLSFREAILAALKADAGVTAVVGAKTYPLRAPQSAKTPFLLFQVISNPRDSDLDGPTGTAEARVQFTACARDLGSCYTTTEAVRQLFQGYGRARGALPGGVLVDEAEQENEADFYDAPDDSSDVGTFRLVSEYVFLYRESLPANVTRP